MNERMMRVAPNAVAEFISAFEEGAPAAPERPLAKMGILGRKKVRAQEGGGGALWSTAHAGRAVVAARHKPAPVVCGCFSTELSLHNLARARTPRSLRPRRAAGTRACG